MVNELVRRGKQGVTTTETGEGDSLRMWAELYIKGEVTTAESSRRVQVRDLERFLFFMEDETGGDRRPSWTPRLTRKFVDRLASLRAEDGTRSVGDRTINRILSHIRTFAKFVHSHAPFPLGVPTDRVSAVPVGNVLEIEKAITPAERTRILDAADFLPEDRKRKDRNRFAPDQRPGRKNARPLRDRAIIYTLIETGMRRAAVVGILVKDVDFERSEIRVREKGGGTHPYIVSKIGLEAIRDYAEKERSQDVRNGVKYLFLRVPGVRGEEVAGPLQPLHVNRIWAGVCRLADVQGRSPHSARHGMGVHVMKKTGNVAAVQRQLGHKNPVCSIQYARITREELKKVVEER